MTIADFMHAHEFITLCLGLQAIAMVGYVGQAFAAILGRRSEKDTP